jgi:hypothetical protein
MSTLALTALSGTMPLAFVSGEALLIAAAGLAALGAALTVVIARRADRQKPESREHVHRRAPSPSSLGMADDPIVAAIEAGAEQGAPSRRVRSPDRIDP